MGMVHSLAIKQKEQHNHHKVTEEDVSSHRFALLAYVPKKSQ